MDDSYRTSHQGIAAYLVSEGYEVVEAEKGHNKKGKPCIEMTFNTSREEGRRLGDSFFQGRAEGNLKDFYDACFKVRGIVYNAKNED